jgi:hypothetical protein
VLILGKCRVIGSSEVVVVELVRPLASYVRMH